MFKREVEEKILNRRGSIANIHSAYMEFHEGVSAHFDFYESILLNDDLPLNRTQSEFLAVETSKANECPYCIKHHKETLQQQELPLSELEQSLLHKLAVTLTKEPWKTPSLQKEFIANGFTLAKWQHAVMIVGYFNLANRMAFGMDLEIEADYYKSCKN
jgi:AhpD family alkylhydroperoxidase